MVCVVAGGVGVVVMRVVCVVAGGVGVVRLLEELGLGEGARPRLAVEPQLLCPDGILASLVAVVMHSRANVRAWRTRPRMNCGGVWKKAHLVCSVAGRSMSSRLDKVCPLCLDVAAAVCLFWTWGGVVWPRMMMGV